MRKDPQLMAAESARRKHYEAINDVKFTDGQLSYNPTVVKAGKLYQYYSNAGDIEAASRIMDLLNRTINHLRGIDSFAGITPDDPFIPTPDPAHLTYAYILAESGSFLITEDNNAIIQ